MLPREHGAYSQMVLPLLTALLVSGVTLAAGLVALAVVFGFLAHEPLLVLLGRRGVRVRAAAAPRATKALVAYGAATVVLGGVALMLAPSAARWSFALPAIPAVAVAAGLVMKREKSAPAELAVAVAFSFSAIPICLIAGVPVAVALSIGLVFASVFVTGTLAVRTIILKVRAGGRPKAVRTTRVVLVLTAVVAASAFAIGATRGALSWAPFAAGSPGLLAAVWLACRPSPPALKTVGWTLMSTSAAAAVILMTAL